ncbi:MULTISPECIES: DUF6766 family protein [Microbacterium]|uniref:DUF6766 family protein n=1 Tax=Microbacterium TaxID=33882 RepID=UPI00217EDA8D|nr:MULTISPECIES: DUF6766 family protein [Microbacterium]UWF77249.1 hypothetical protein JSY13_10740 [Microbacterium neungamense]WCM55404.1 hypothetical protein JRG78_10725 [Microbacterium sp. EF45047]
MRRFLKDNGLSLFFLVLFLLALAGQSVAGWLRTNEEIAQHGMAPEGYLPFVFSSDFVVDVAENWQSEFLQFLLFIAATVWFIQRGSPESKKPDDQGPATDEDQLVGEYAPPDAPKWAKVTGIRLWLYENSLVLVMGAIFVLSWLLQSLSGVVVANEEHAQHGEAPITWAEYVVSPDFWDRTLQNWQSEFLAVGTMVAFSIFLRQRSSAESKPVGAPHHVAAWESE